MKVVISPLTFQILLVFKDSTELPEFIPGFCTIGHYGAFENCVIIPNL